MNISRWVTVGSWADDQRHELTQCDRAFTRQDSMQRHVRLTHKQSFAPREGAEASSEASIPIEPYSSSSWTEADEQASSSGQTGSPVVRDDADDQGDHFEELDYGLGLDQAAMTREPASIRLYTDVELCLDSSEPLFSFPMGQPVGEDIWQLLSQDLLPGCSSLRASPQFLTDLGLEADSLFQPMTSTRPSAQMARSDLYLYKHTFDGPTIPSDPEAPDGHGDLALSAASTIVARMSRVLRHARTLPQHVLDPSLADMPDHSPIHVQRPPNLCTTPGNHHCLGQYIDTESRHPGQGGFDCWYLLTTGPILVAPGTPQRYHERE
ncbi:hypothetical protein IAU60_003163 [Kwoniella sp. DSM 27419]